MNKFLKIFAVLMLAAPVFLIACGGDDDDDNQPNNGGSGVVSNSIIGSWKLASSSDTTAPIGSIFTFAADGKMTTTFSGWKDMEMTYTYKDNKLIMYAYGQAGLEANIVIQGNKASGTFRWIGNPNNTGTYNLTLERQ